MKKSYRPKKEPNAVTMPNLNPKPSHTKHLSGSNHEQFTLMLVNQVSRSIWTAHSDEDYKEKQLASVPRSHGWHFTAG